MDHNATTLVLKERFENGLATRLRRSELLEAGLRLTSTETINNLYILGRIYWIREEFTKAIEYASKSHNAAVESLGIDDDDTVKARLLLENICRRQRDFKYLINFRKDVLQRYNSAFGPLDARTLNVQNELLLAYHEAGEFAQSLDLGEELLRHLGDAGVEDNRLKYAKRKQGMGLAIVWKLRDGRGLEPPRSDLARAIYLLEDALHMDESQGVEDPKVILQQLRMLRDLYIIIKDWMKALDRGRLAVRKSVELHGAYSKDALDDRDELLQLELHRGYTREVFDVALDIYHNCVAIHGYDSDRTLVAVMGLHKLLNDIGAGEEDRINVFNLLWTTFLNIETLGGRKQRLEREIILPALEELEASAPPSEKCRMKEIKDLHILINETSPEENHDTTEDLQMRSPQDEASISLSDSEQSYRGEPRLNSAEPKDSNSSDENRKRELHKDKVDGYSPQSGDSWSSAQSTSEDDDSSLLDRIDALEVAEKAGKARLVSDEPSDEEMLHLVEELSARRVEERCCREFGVHDIDSFGDWPEPEPRLPPPFEVDRGESENVQDDDP